MGWLLLQPEDKEQVDQQTSQTGLDLGFPDDDEDGPSPEGNNNIQNWQTCCKHITLINTDGQAGRLSRICQNVIMSIT